MPPSPAPTTNPALSVGSDPAVPQGARILLQEEIARRSGDLIWVADSLPVDLRLVAGEASAGTPVGSWTYAVAAPFRAIDDEVTSADLLATWRGSPQGPFTARPLLVSENTLAVLRHLWGEPGSAIHTTADANLLAEAERSGAWAILPFDQLQPPWKVLRVDGLNLLEKEIRGYPLQVPLSLVSEQRPDAPAPLGLAPDALSNRREDRMTIVAMTGVTALTRATALTMETRGITYPAQDIGEWLASADITHISNEVSFTPDCPVPPIQNTLRFCSHDRYIALLEAVGTDIVELTGNDLLAYGPEPLYHTLELYRERGWRWYGGGADLVDATRPLTVTHGPNRLAFLGCNAFGPPGAWASEGTPGSAPCDYEQMKAQIYELRAAGYLPIVTIQHTEIYEYMPTPDQVAQFRSLAEAGAVVVRGSQAHQPQAFEFHGDTFIHYGQGNLFFDQMSTLGTRQEFVNRLIFYDGRLLSIELRTAILEEYARPRPMTPEERRSFLELIFQLRP